MACLLGGRTRLTKCITSFLSPLTFFLESTTTSRLKLPVAKCLFVEATSSELFKNFTVGSLISGEFSKSLGNSCQTNGTENIDSFASNYSPANISKPRNSKILSSLYSSSNFSKPDKRTFSTFGRTKIYNPDRTSRDFIDSQINRRNFSSPLDDPCKRECKISHRTTRCQDSFERHACEKPPTNVCPPSGENARKLKFWRAATIFGALPAVLIASIIILKKAEEESKQPRPDFIPMEYMYRRVKRFPWGDGNHTLFHNPIKNAVPPDGYEVEDPNAATKK